MAKERLSLIGKSRRDILTGVVGYRRGQIASLLVQARPEHLDDIERRVTGLAGVESHGRAPAGKLIVTIEADDDSGLMDAINLIQATPGVINASLVYHAMDDFMEEETADA